MAPNEKTYRGRNQADVLAELAAMRAASEISSEELQAAREKILGGRDAAMPPPRTTEKVVVVERKPKSGGLGCGGVLLLLFAIFVIGSMMNPNAKNSPEEKAKAAAESAEDRRKGFHCLSKWDGSDPNLVSAVKKNMREPSSFEHVETRITPIDEKGQHTVLMAYRGRNGFGGMNVAKAVGVISNAGCTLLSVVSE